MRLCNEHVEEEDAEESTPLLIGQLQTSLLGGESKLKYRLQHEGRHEMVEELPRLVHLVAAPDNLSHYLEYLLSHEVVIRILLQAVYAMLKDFLPEGFELQRV